MYCYEGVLSGVGWWEVVDVMCLFTSLSCDKYI